MTGKSWCHAPRAFLVLAGLSVLTGCSDDPYKPPVFPFLSSYKAARSGAPVLLSNADWWKKFDDPTLNALIETGLAGNLNLDLAKERVIEAQAIQRAVPQSAFLSPRAGVGYERGETGESRTRANASLGFEWILDIYGGRRAQIDAAGARIEVADAEVDAAQLLLLLNIANAYVDLRYQQTALQLRRSELKSRRQTLNLIERLQQGSAATKVDVVRAQALVSETRADIPETKAAIDAAKNELAVLLGKVPGALQINLDGPVRQPRVSLSPEVGIPADLLRNRPDIRVAERSYYASFRDVAGARADLYPQLSLSGTITSATLSAARPEYFFGPVLQFPILPNSSNRAKVEQRQSLVRQAHTQWRLTVLEAIRDVETSLADYSASLSAQRAAEETVRLYKEVVTLTRQIVTGDGATIRDLIDAEQNVATANTTLAATLNRVGRSFVALNVNLGSGHGVGKDKTGN
ncbi:outer membrane protein, multidrug efflux system [Roseovarius marisflavi]|uniref:Outer membrane protein, multidrug efflux system n=1 Tax=Roseovarius marisflavi TaxID=1054996 RepID=A0A1M7CHL3_9RHOB|nr:efflux transporter outer membrane subunit [Roseovarius marisflavi]SHL66697.1 outer membrane protein, multidrug efflux system [Roseovarius marisflavi]